MTMTNSVSTESPAPEGVGSVPFATECDLVMKGGITSGVVYPLAIVELSKAFRLRSIGGTSAGAIAAAATAAAEVGRQRFRSGQIKNDPDGFATLGKLPDHLGADAANGRGTKLLGFFKPKAELRPVFDALVAALAAKGLSARFISFIGALLRHYWLVALCAFAVGVLPLWFLLWSKSAWLQVVWLLIFAAVLAITAVAVRVLLLLFAELPNHGFGFCSGMPSKDDQAKDESLTVWLAKYIDELAGQDQAFPNQNKPLTFGDLKAQGVDLQMVTTCLTMGRPFRLPFGDDGHIHENNQFLFRKSELESLFPKHVVSWMETHERHYQKDQDGPFSQINFDGFFSLPVPDDLPVVVATRMSLSFPLLLSAIPLYSIDLRKERTPGETPERCWFTDGGVGSNFPIHFFDAPLPTRPTFGLDLGLADMPDQHRVVFPRNNGDARLPYWRRFAEGGGLGSLKGFLGAIVNVAKDWNHETLSHLPGFRDRIGLIKLTKEEGGLNLTMPAERIRQLTEYGRDAGAQFVVRFGNPALWPPGYERSKMDWENHQLIRLRLILASISEMVTALQLAISNVENSPQNYGRFFSTDQRASTYRFAGINDLAIDSNTGRHKTQAGLAKWVLDELVSIAKRITDTVAAAPPPAPSVELGKGAPKPLPELKLRPRV